MSLAGIFDDDQTVALSQLHNRVHVGHLPVEVHGNHRGDRSLEFPMI